MKSIRFLSAVALLVVSLCLVLGLVVGPALAAEPVFAPGTDCDALAPSNCYGDITVFSVANDTGRLVNSINGTADVANAQAVITAGSGSVKYARMLEFGTAKIAARPFFFAAVEKSRAWIVERLNKSLRDGLIKVVKR